MLSKIAAPPAADSTRARTFWRYGLGFVVPGLVLLRCAWIFSALWRTPGLPLHLAQDDFYYYLKPAQNLAWHHLPAVFDHTPTNGYHPLYFLLLTAVSLFVRTVPGVFRFLWVLDTASAVSVFFLSRRLYLQRSSPLLANALGVLTTALCVTQICDQMEVTLALPLGFAFLAAASVEPPALTPRRLILIGLLAAFLFLARLDAVLLVALWALALVSCRAYRFVVTSRHFAAFLAASLPLPLLYLAINRAVFGTLLPISGMAKQLRRGWAPTPLFLRSFNGTTELLLALTLAGAVLAWALRRRLPPRDSVLLFAALGMPLCFYATEMVVSDWPAWDWYFYALRFSATGVFLLLATWWKGASPSPVWSKIARSDIPAAAFCVLTLLKLFTAKYKVDAVMVDIQHAGEVLQQFAAEHPGTYAMGDRAGMFTTLTDQPVLQTEGLVMDRGFLQHIRDQDDLVSVLTRYRVRYYVTFVFDRNRPWQARNGCFHALEPSIPGPSALHMRAELCDAPVFAFSGDDGEYFIFQLQH